MNEGVDTVGIDGGNPELPNDSDIRDPLFGKFMLGDPSPFPIGIISRLLD